ncbi:pyridoxamine 5'-phosphate oxidase family protein [Roseobacter sp. YSTF-M11]|uniref:Pyridoxamine 5'-phosphate oxidase family protein n=1 Tax=Roseobacter insulae TaxID=2859783 RepID=A0A9X1FVN3_9RHOB|nr:pyridoxamine 5'-phosphate oxidase family protein [Roseobacter insulae]MBW4708214.1 pyridoxamine 5'-phosphate oxidase family protein [Roseobacter insulae]
MPTDSGWTQKTSPFHRGERAAQEKSGVRDRLETLGRRAVRDFMPDQHRAFFADLPMIFVGHVDDAGWPWASVLYGGPGFITTPDSRSLTLTAQPLAGDPLNDALTPGRSLGFVGMGLSNRRRNRVNGHVAQVGDQGFEVSVDQSFGNCPQYIKTRDADLTHHARSAPVKETSDTLDDAARQMIRAAETFFVATATQPHAAGGGVHGADVSHRGGRRGFVKVERDTLTVPDFSGNNFFNTLGNMIENPRAGLLFIDYTTGDLLMVSGTTDIHWDPQEIAEFRGATRFWQLKVRRVLRLRAALPVTWTEQDGAPNIEKTGTWDEVAAALAARR